MNNINKKLQHTAKLLEIEKNEDLALFRQQLQAESFTERRNKGVLWYPVAIEETTFDSGERLIVKATRHSEHLQSHLFQSGKLVSIFHNRSNNSDTEEYSVSGVVNSVRDNQMIITLNTEEIPEWITFGKIGIQLLFDDYSYREMQKTLQYLIETDEKRINQLKEIILGDKEAVFEHKYLIENPRLNAGQNKALNLIDSALDIAIVHGPPGTGKTTTIVNAVLHTLKKEKQILVCAPSNAAVDLLVEKLSEQGTNIVRIGHPARVEDKILHRTIDYQITQHPDYQILKKLKREVKDIKKSAGKYKRNFGDKERQQRNELYKQARQVNDEIKHLSFHITNSILNSAEVIATTLVGANHHLLQGRRFSTVFIDEAAQGLEPATWIPIAKANRVIFAGDHNQLPPTLKSIKAAKDGLEITLFEKAIKNNSADVMLEEQYRMHEKIMAFSSKFFYKNKLFANPIVAEHLVFQGDTPVEFIDTVGMDYTEQGDERTLSTYNPDEIELLFKHLADYLYKVEQNKSTANLQNIGIIAPYRAQVVLLQKYFDENFNAPEEYKKIISVNTIDSFQGQERDVIYISLVRSNSKGKIGFLSDIRRLNVAMTRARKKLVIIGDSSTISTHDFYAKFIEYVTQINAYKSGFEIIY